MRRFMILFCCCVLLLGIIVPIYAKDEYDELCRQIAESVSTGEPVDVSAYGLTREELQDIYQDMCHRGLLPWYVDTYADWSSGPDGKITRIVPRDMRDRGFDEITYERSMAELIAATCHEGMTQEQMVLSVHDYIATQVQFSYLSVHNNGYQALVNKQSACYGYALLFMRVMEQMNIPCQIVICEDTGDGIGHAWNVVCLNENWYHIDVTWDDPTKDVYGRVMHRHFLKTDKEFKSKKNGHTFDWEVDVKCTDRTYAYNPFWEDITSPVLFTDDNSAYYRKDDGDCTYIYKLDLQTNKESLVYKQKLSPVRLANVYYYSYAHGLVIRNDRIWFSTAQAVYSVTLSGEDLRTEYTCETLDEGIVLCGFHIMQNELYLTFVNIEDEITKTQIPLTDDGGHIHSYQSQSVKATCDKNGYKQHTCACGIVFYTDHTPKSGHDMVLEQTQDGQKLICRRCGHSDIRALPIEEVQTAMSGWIIAVVCLGVLCISVLFVIYLRRKRCPHK